MELALRVIALVFVVPAAYYFVYWFSFSLSPIGEQRWIVRLVSLLLAVAAGWFVWVKLAAVERSAISSIALGAVLLGGVGFTVGFFGPVIFAPEANQGPLLGIFITGPLGIVVGGIVGWIYWMAHRAGPSG